jgi:acyl dehydratase
MSPNNKKLFKTIIRNYRSKSLNKDYVGYSRHKTLKKISKEEIREYAKATRDENPEYKKDNPILPAGFISKIIWPEIKEIITEKKLKMNILRMVHAEQKISWFKPIHSNDSLNLNIEINNICSTPAGEQIDIVCKIYTNSELALESISSLIVRSKKRTKNLKKIDTNMNHEEIFSCKIETQEGQELEYAEASGDYNFIHTNKFFAKLAGLSGPILHGACVMSMCCSQLTNQLLKGDLKRLKELKLRFAYPVYPGEELNLTVFKTDNSSEVNFEVRNAADKLVIRNGALKYN